MSRELEALLGRSVDVVSVGGLKSRDQAILTESVDLPTNGTVQSNGTGQSSRAVGRRRRHGLT